MRTQPRIRPHKNDFEKGEELSSFGDSKKISATMQHASRLQIWLVSRHSTIGPVIYPKGDL